jgi:hypothetical protein
MLGAGRCGFLSCTCLCAFAGSIPKRLLPCAAPTPARPGCVCRLHSYALSQLARLLAASNALDGAGGPAGSDLDPGAWAALSSVIQELQIGTRTGEGPSCSLTGATHAGSEEDSQLHAIGFGCGKLPELVSEYNRRRPRHRRLPEVARPYISCTAKVYSQALSPRDHGVALLTGAMSQVVGAADVALIAHGMAAAAAPARAGDKVPLGGTFARATLCCWARRQAGLGAPDVPRAPPGSAAQPAACMCAA